MKQRGLIDINMILDTRYGALRRIDAPMAERLARSDWYRVRDTDRFEFVSHGAIKDAEFKELYDKMEVETLEASIFTDYIYELRRDVKEGFSRMERLDPGTVIEFTVNVWPYDLLESEMEVIKRAFARYLPPVMTLVDVVSIPHEKLTPSLVATAYEMLAFYNYEDWLKHHHTALLERPIPEVTLFTVRVAPSGTVPKPDHVVQDPFMALPAILMKHLNIRILPTSVACWNPVVYDKLTTPDVEEGESTQDSTSM